MSKPITTIKKCVALVYGFNGKKYHGFQIAQEGINTVSKTFYDALNKCGLIHPRNVSDPHRINYVSCSRTDKGVHALRMVTSANLLVDYSQPNPAKDIVDKLNSILPNDICVYSSKIVTNSFHARHDCIARQYIYYLPYSVLPSEKEYELFQQLFYYFGGSHNFINFYTYQKNVEKDVMRSIFINRIEKLPDYYKIKIAGNSFLYNQIRMIISSILSVIHQKITAEQLIQSIDSSKRTISYPLVPSNTLILERPFFNQLKSIRIYLNDYKEEEEEEEKELINLMDDCSNEKMMNFYNQNIKNSILDDLNSSVFDDYLYDIKYWNYRIESNQICENNQLNQKSFIYPKFYDLKENEIDDKKLCNTHYGIGSFICNYYQDIPTKRIYEIKLGILRYCLKNKVILKSNEDIKQLLDKFGDKYFIDFYNDNKKK